MDAQGCIWMHLSAYGRITEVHKCIWSDMDAQRVHGEHNQQASKPASQQASKTARQQASKPARKQAIKQASKQTSKQVATIRGPAAGGQALHI